MKFITACGREESAELAKVQRGAFPLFEESILPQDTPQRNGTITTIAPTGTLSIIARMLLRRGAGVRLCVYPQYHGRDAR